MIKKTLLLLFCGTVSSLFGQKKSTTTQNDGIAISVNQNILYFGIENTIKIFTKKQTCDDLEIIFNTDTIVSETPCYFRIIPKKIGRCEVKILDKKANSIIGETQFYAKPLPSPQLTIDGKTKGTIPLKEMKIQMGVGAEIIGLDIQNHFLVKSFSIMIIRNDQVVANLHNSGNMFSEEVKQAIFNVEAGDRVLFSDNSIVKQNQIEKISPTEYIIE